MMTFTQAAKAYTADTQTAGVLECNTWHEKATTTWLKYSDKFEKYFWDVLVFRSETAGVTGTHAEIENIQAPPSSLLCSHPFPLMMLSFLAGSRWTWQQCLDDTATTHYQVGTFTIFFSFCYYRGNTRKPEKVEYCHPPTRFPFSSFR